jgi:hypothetical protein
MSQDEQIELNFDYFKISPKGDLNEKLVPLKRSRDDKTDLGSGEVTGNSFVTAKDKMEEDLKSNPTRKETRRKRPAFVSPLLSNKKEKELKTELKSELPNDQHLKHLDQKLVETIMNEIKSSVSTVSW